jgi:RNA polymerase sigma factor (sigma-70 family)
MNFEYIEEIVTKCKNGDMLSKENLAKEFRPFILNLSKRTFIDRYEMQDIQGECYKTLFNCVSLYNSEKHRFVAYATNSIRNNINDLIKRVKTRQSTDGNDALSFQDDMENNLPSQNVGLEDSFCDECDHQELKFAINNLTEEEKELVDFVFYKNNTVRTYAYIKNMCYSTAAQRKNVILKKINKAINQY